jgi:hypothetical protein
MLLQSQDLNRQVERAMLYMNSPEDIDLKLEQNIEGHYRRRSHLQRKRSLSLLGIDHIEDNPQASSMLYQHQLRGGFH